MANDEISVILPMREFTRLKQIECDKQPSDWFKSQQMSISALELRSQHDAERILILTQELEQSRAEIERLKQDKAE